MSGFGVLNTSETEEMWGRAPAAAGGAAMKTPFDGGEMFSRRGADQRPGSEAGEERGRKRAGRKGAAAAISSLVGEGGKTGKALLADRAAFPGDRLCTGCGTGCGLYIQALRRNVTRKNECRFASTPSLSIVSGICRCFSKLKVTS